MRQLRPSNGFTLVEVLVAMIVISIVTLGSLSALRLFANKNNANGPIYRSGISYKNIKNQFHHLISLEQLIQPSYRCVLTTLPSSPDQFLQNALCNEEVYVDVTGKTKINLIPSLSLNNGSGVCVYQVQLTFTPLVGATFTRSWMDQYSC